MSDSAMIQPAARDEQLAHLLNDLTNQFRQGQRPDLDGLARQHPELADELRELWAAVQVAEELAKPSPEVTPSTALGMPGLQETELSPRTTAPLPRMFGDYELLEEIGRGGMGVVYKAQQRSLDRIVAIKMILRGDHASAEDLARFKAEAEAAARLEHPNIVSIYEVGECEGQAYFSMKYVEGTTLAERVAAGPMAPREAAACLATICAAVHHLHQAGILHRDLKPSNVLIDKQGRPQVTDFGLAKRVEGGASLTQTGAILGTPSYMSPEQAAGGRRELSPASDVYSLGTILYALITGQPPFQAASAFDIIRLVIEQEPAPPRLLNRRVDRELEMICLKCLQKPADLRYRGADQLEADLMAYLNGEPIAARPSGMAYFVGRMLRETHHAAILENWGLLWMWNSLALLILCSVTNGMHLAGVEKPGPYLALWMIGLGTWSSIFWALRRRGGPVTFIERQIAHVWSAGVAGSISMFFAEYFLGLPVLKLSPVLAVIAGMVFLVKAGMLTGSFYLAAVVMFGTAGLMALFPTYGLFLFGLVSAGCFFIPGLKYYRQHLRSIRSLG